MKERAGAIVAEEGVVHRVGRARRAERQIAGGQRFRQTDDVGRDVGVLARKHPAGAAESGEHFVGDEQHAEAIAEPAHAGEKFRRPDDHPAGALQHRLDDAPRRPLASCQRTPASASRSRQAIDLAGRALEAERAPIAVRRVRAHDLEQQRRERARENRILAHRHRADRVAVIRVVQRDEGLRARLAPVDPVLAGPASPPLRRPSIRCPSRRRASARAAARSTSRSARSTAGRMRAAREHHVLEPRAPARRARRSARDASGRGCSPTTTRCRRGCGGRPPCRGRRPRR